MSSPAANLAGTPAVETFARFGTATIPAGNALFAVADTAITANSVVLVQLVSDNGVLATQPGHAVCLQPGTGFTIRTTTNAVAGTGLICSFAVLRY
jgi:hypothetical protein